MNKKEVKLNLSRHDYYTLCSLLKDHTDVLENLPSYENHGPKGCDPSILEAFVLIRKITEQYDLECLSD